jgi:hypothetical protein
MKFKYQIIDRVVGEKVESNDRSAIFGNLWERLEEYGNTARSYKDVENTEQKVYIIERA